MSRGDSLYRLEYRAPEILLGLRLNEAVDMWALGCLMARMYIEADLYSGECELAKMEDVVLLNGQPDDRMLFFGIHTKRYFAESGTELELKTDCVCSFQSVNCFSYGSHPPYRYSSAKRFISFNDIVMARPDATGHEDTEAFVSLLRNMLQVDPGKRITPNKALRHPFITMKHFPSDFIPHNLTVVSTSEKLPPTGSLNNMVAESSPESAGRNSRAANKSSDDSLDDEDDEFSSHSDGHVSGASANSCGDSSDDEETDSEMSGATTKSLDDLSDDEDSNAEISRASRNSSDEPSDDKETDETSPAFASDYSYISNKISNEEVTKIDLKPGYTRQQAFKVASSEDLIPVIGKKGKEKDSNDTPTVLKLTSAQICGLQLAGTNAQTPLIGPRVGRLRRRRRRPFVNRWIYVFFLLHLLFPGD
ncbi:homeodomain-interacting protein kinase 2-like [Solea senegalensis]|uniref:Homeodomain-interacting protein kinase 2-like n=1 Tax=Solea senegalensis TaxID=28829 RepID=A0AAV6SQN5_SOLSE|nr:homeodomain-interacting protein kinase 2-like [Solea senegalensis]